MTSAVSEDEKQNEDNFQYSVCTQGRKENLKYYFHECLVIS